MKKVIYLLLALTLMLTAVGCADDSQSAYDLYTSALSTYQAGYEADVSLAMQIGEQSAQGVLHVKTAGNDAALTRADSTDARYYVDGTCYRSGYSIGGVHYDGRVKLALEKNAFMTECTGMYGINPFAQAFPTFTVEALQGVELAKSGAFSSFAVDMTEEMIRNYLGNPTFERAEGGIVATFNGTGQMTSLLFRFDVFYSESDVRAFEIVYRFQSIGTIPAILPPADADSYIEL